MKMQSAVRSGSILAAAALAVATFAAPAGAGVYPDATGEEFSGNTNLDISSVEITNTATDITFKVNLVGDIVATNWGKYMIGIDSIAGGDTAGNGWGRPISMSSGMDYWVGSWADSGGGDEVYHWGGSAWVRDHASYDAVNPLTTPTLAQFSTTMTVPLAYLGLVDGSSFHFDVYSAGGGGTDSANDASSNPNQSTAGWSGPYDSALQSVYTVSVPEPTCLTLGTVSAAGVMIRRRRK
jgi:hypothetical protein